MRKWVWAISLGVVIGSGCSGSLGDAPGAPSREGGGGPGTPGNPGRGSGGDPVPVAAGAPGLEASLAAPSGLRRLTAYEYDNTLRDLLADTSRPSRAVLPDDARVPFDNDYTVQVASKALVDGLELLAGEAVTRLLADKPRRDAVVGCTPKAAADAACWKTFVERFGRRALRRPLTAAEIAKLETTFLPFATEAQDFHAAVDPALRAFLQHGELVYRVELGTAVAGQTGLWKLNPFELASRLSFFLWGGPPDDALLDRAANKTLATDTGVREAASAMLADPRARALVSRFTALWLRYEGMATGSADLDAALQAESTALVERVVFTDKRPFQDLFRVSETFVTDALAKHYGLPAPGGAAKWMPYGATGRRGLLSHGTFLSNGAKGGDTSPTRRGMAVRELLLCEEIPPPPPGVDTDNPPPATSTATCKQDRYAAHSVGGCADCHKLVDPIGFGLERFDAQGRARATEPGRPSCALPSTGELAPLGSFSGPAELSDLLLRSGRLGACAVSQLYKFAAGRSKLGAEDEKIVSRLAARHTASGADFRLTDVLLDFVSSEAFSHRRNEP